MGEGRTCEHSGSAGAGAALHLAAVGPIRSGDERVRSLPPLANVKCRSDPSACIPAAEAAGRPKKRRGPPPEVRDEKRVDRRSSGGNSSPRMLAGVGEVQRGAEDAQTLLFPARPIIEAAPAGSADASGGHQSMRPFKRDPVKHKIFLSHSGAQKDFVEQLCVDLERRGNFFPFFDQRQHSLPNGEDFVLLIKEAASMCRVAVVFLSKEYLCSKWPMIELAEFHAARQAGNDKLKVLPAFYKLSPTDLNDESIGRRWIRAWTQLSRQDERINVERFSAAVRWLRRMNGPPHEDGMSEVQYRATIVNSICSLSPPDVLNGSSRDMVGYDRICKEASVGFVENRTVGARVLGLYGGTGMGKSTLSRALCLFFYEEFEGRVCHVQLDEAPSRKRVQVILERLCGMERDVVDRITDDGQGLMHMRERMRRKPVYLGIDNVSADDDSLEGALKYLTVGFHPQSRVMVTSRSEDIVQKLLDDGECCMAIPGLNAEEAGAILLKSGASSKSMSMLTEEERSIVDLCTRECLLFSQRDVVRWRANDDELSVRPGQHVPKSRQRSYHPLALTTLGMYLFRQFGTDVLHWKRDLEEKKLDPLKVVWTYSNDVEKTISLQFNSLRGEEQLLFMDIAVYLSSSRALNVVFRCGDPKFWVVWLSKMHDEPVAIIRRTLVGMKHSGMISYDERDPTGPSVYDLYRKFAEWHVAEHGMAGLKNAQCMFRSSGAVRGGGSRAADMVRLRVLGDLTRTCARLLAGAEMQALDYLEVLQLVGCCNVRELNLEGFGSLRHLELCGLANLVSVTLSGSSSGEEGPGIHESLQCVVLEGLGILESLQCVLLEGLDSLTHGPDVRSCTSLDWVVIDRCPKLTNLEGLECPRLKELFLLDLHPHQLARLPNVRSLQSLEALEVYALCEVDMFGAMDAVREHGLGNRRMPCFRMLEEVVQYLRTKWVVPGIGDDRSLPGKLILGWKKAEGGSEELYWNDPQRGVVRMYSGSPEGDDIEA